MGAPPVKRTPIPVPTQRPIPLPATLTRRASSRAATKAATNPETNKDILDAPNALRASPDSDVEPPVADKKARAGKKKGAVKAEAKDEAIDATPKEAAKAQNDAVWEDPEADGDEEADEQEIKEASMRPPPVNSDYLPLPWKGRLGYACLNTYLRQSHPPVFSSRTCRIASIVEHRHPLKDPNEPEHATKNRPDREQPADVARGQAYVEALGLANARDIIKMLRWNDRYGIKFLRLSSEMFPFASHEEYGYKLAPFAAEALAEVGKVVAELGHRVTTHPGQFTQLGSPRKSVIDNAIRDLAYHDEMLSLLKLPEQQNRDAVMILHLGGVFGDKAATLDRFRENYASLSQSIKNRLVLENDDVSWTVHDLLPVCEELNIPMVLDYHHHNIMFDSAQLREGTKDIMDLYPRITATWNRKGIKQKMHYSEPTPPAITGQQRRKHNPRPATLPPCADDMDLMIEAKDKEQAVFELMRTFKLPGFGSFADIIPHVRLDDNRPPPGGANKKKKNAKKTKKNEEDEDPVEDSLVEEALRVPIPEDDVGMGGPEGRVYWPPGMEEWLRPAKRIVKKKEAEVDAEGNAKLTPAQKRKAKMEEQVRKEAEAAKVKAEDGVETKKAPAKKTAGTAAKGKGKGKVAAGPAAAAKRKAAKAVPTPSTSAGEEDEDDDDVEMQDLGDDDGDDDVVATKPGIKRRNTGTRTSGRAGRGRVSYKEVDGEGSE
ncbi:UV-endonuclease UvdE [Saccharata proteae CBS 121410]|uniref:UV-endonuclease UvdE n=1 Tax=Saccharata proteae CBS 121410 TaxID=1314787 RepID=A0A9P4HZ20_9PEZI|nr:UV-endonuclease UvdE [Saccharata proteae CBS 121410]